MGGKTKEETILTWQPQPELMFRADIDDSNYSFDIFGCPTDGVGPTPPPLLLDILIII